MGSHKCLIQSFLLQICAHSNIAIFDTNIFQ